MNLVEEYAEALCSLKLLYFDCGRRDEYQLLYGARILAKRLKALDIPHRYEEFDGGHTNVQYRYDVSLQAISQAMAVWIPASNASPPRAAGSGTVPHSARPLITCSGSSTAKITR